MELQFLGLLVGLASCEGLLCRLLGAGPVLALLSNTILLQPLVVDRDVMYLSVQCNNNLTSTN